MPTCRSPQPSAKQTQIEKAEARSARPVAMSAFVATCRKDDKD